MVEGFVVKFRQQVFVQVAASRRHCDIVAQEYHQSNRFRKFNEVAQRSKRQEHTDLEI
jgi:hypothetical protein